MDHSRSCCVASFCNCLQVVKNVASAPAAAKSVGWASNWVGRVRVGLMRVRVRVALVSVRVGR